MREEPVAGIDPMTMGSCGECLFWSRGSCHRHPPAPVLSDSRPHHAGRIFPATSATDWCGEFLSRNQGADPLAAQIRGEVAGRRPAREANDVD